jgi:hypothetical protein
MHDNGGVINHVVSMVRVSESRELPKQNSRHKSCDSSWFIPASQLFSMILPKMYFRRSNLASSFCNTNKSPLISPRSFSKVALHRLLFFGHRNVLKRTRWEYTLIGIRCCAHSTELRRRPSDWAQGIANSLVCRTFCFSHVWLKAVMGMWLLELECGVLVCEIVY